TAANSQTLFVRWFAAGGEILFDTVGIRASIIFTKETIENAWSTPILKTECGAQLPCGNDRRLPPALHQSVRFKQPIKKSIGHLPNTIFKAYSFDLILLFIQFDSGRIKHNPAVVPRMSGSGPGNLEFG